MTAPWLTIVGIGEDGIDGLSAIARTALDKAEILVGGARHLAMIPPDGRRRIPWASPMDRTIAELVTLAGRKVAIIATGDPMWYGIGATLRRTFAAARRAARVSRPPCRRNPRPTTHLPRPAR